MLPFLFVLTLICISEELLARAGGGGGGGRGGGISGGGYGYHSGYYYHGYRSGSNNDVSGGSVLVIMLLTAIIWGLVAFSFTLTMIARAAKTRKMINKANKFDAFWNEERMKKWSTQMFRVMQDCWMKRNMEPVQPLVSPELFMRYTLKLNRMKQLGHVNMIKDIHIKSVKIVSAFDHKDDHKDRFTALIKGDLLDYTFHEETRGIIKNPEKEYEDFEDFYHFVRKGDVWLLDDIVNDPETADIRKKEKEYSA